MKKNDKKNANLKNALKVVSKNDKKRDTAHAEKHAPKVEKEKAVTVKKPTVNADTLRTAIETYTAALNTAVQAVDHGKQLPSLSEMALYVAGISYIVPEKSLTLTDAIQHAKTSEQAAFIAKYIKGYFGNNSAAVSADLKKAVQLFSAAVIAKA